VLASNEYKPDGPFYTQDRTQQRQFLANAWQKFLNKEGLDPLETQLTQYTILIRNKFD
jgi:hypothetical protein